MTAEMIAMPEAALFRKRFAWMTFVHGLAILSICWRPVMIAGKSVTTSQTSTDLTTMMPMLVEFRQTKVKKTEPRTAETPTPASGSPIQPQIAMPNRGSAKIPSVPEQSKASVLSQPVAKAESKPPPARAAPEKETADDTLAIKERKLLQQLKDDYSGSSREIGQTLLGVDGKKDGSVPLITMDYRRNMGWPAYAKEMQRLGGLFFIYDPTAEKILAGANVLSGAIEVVAKDALCGLSPRIREIRDEPSMADILVRARRQFGADNCSLILLMPLNIDFEIVGGIARELAAHGLDPGKVGRVVGEYEFSRNRPLLRADRVVFRDGVTTPVTFEIPL